MHYQDTIYSYKKKPEGTNITLSFKEPGKHVENEKKESL